MIVPKVLPKQCRPISNHTIFRWHHIQIWYREKISPVDSILFGIDSVASGGVDRQPYHVVQRKLNLASYEILIQNQAENTKEFGVSTKQNGHIRSATQYDSIFNIPSSSSNSHLYFS
jgi:hypothetical protein